MALTAGGGLLRANLPALLAVVLLALAAGVTVAPKMLALLPVLALVAPIFAVISCRLKTRGRPPKHKLKLKSLLALLPLADQPVKCGELENVLADMRKYIVNTVQHSQAKLASDLSKVTSKAVTAVVRKQEVKNEEIDMHLRDLDRGVAKVESEQKQMREQLEDMRKQLHIMDIEAPKAFDISDAVNFTRPANKTIFVASAKEMVTLDEVTLSVKPWIEAAGFSDTRWK
ncbi:unnamed protein product, partial [Prorocentrum cordatum]